MTELSGTLDGVGLPAIVRFLSGLKKTGSLRIDHEDWQGEVVFEAGRLTAASFGSRSGLNALDALVQVLPGGRFSFDATPRPSPAPTVELSPEALQAHLDELAARIASGTPSLPSVDAVPTLVLQAEPSATEEPVPLDRGTLQTLLAVDGQRSVRQIVAQRGAFEALWQLGSLAEIGLVRLGAPMPRALVQTPPGSLEVPPSPDARPREQAPMHVAAPLEAAAPGAPPTEAPVEHVSRDDRCPKLGFEDDPGGSFARPTRLHRCFAADTPLPLSLDQQRELCLSDQFGTCPRLQMAARDTTRPAARDVRSPSKAAGVAGTGAVGPSGRLEVVADEPRTDDPRIVRLPFAGRNGGSPRRAASDRHVATTSEPPQLLSSGLASRADDAARPTPLRARVERATSPASPIVAGESAVAPVATPGPIEDAAVAHSLRTRRSESSGLQGSPLLARLTALPVPLVVGIATGLVAVAIIAYLLAPQAGTLFVDEGADLSGLPNASAVAAGTSVAQVAPRRTPVATAATDSGGASAAPASAVAAPTTQVSEDGAAAAVPTPALGQLMPPQTAASGSPAARQPAASPQTPANVTLFDERFASNVHNWPSDSQGTAWLGGGSYRLITRQAGQFVAVGAPIPDVPADVSASATFRKLDGTPAGGGFGIILRDQGNGPRDGINQAGQYYVLEVGDKGEVGIWRRDTDHWVDVLPWQHSDAVHPGTATNELSVSAIGNRLSMTVNGTQVVTRTDATLPTGGIGLLVGGDGNQVAVDSFSVQTP